LENTVDIKIVYQNYAKIPKYQMPNDQMPNYRVQTQFVSIRLQARNVNKLEKNHIIGSYCIVHLKTGQMSTTKRRQWEIRVEKKRKEKKRTKERTKKEQS